MTKGLEFAADLLLPIDAATQTFAFIARKGAGKTYAAGKLTELLLDAGVQVIVLDTVGNWYGLRLSADGQGKGFDIPVLGGLRGDIPLEASGGALIADIVVETGRSLVLDASQFSLGDRKRFATAFAERLWQKKKSEHHPTPLHLVIEESQLIVPQFSKGAEAMVGIYEEIIRLGRNYGIGVSMITQRPQSVNKEVLNQTECLLVGQVNGSQERDALRKWITHQGMDVHLVDELPTLKVGTFYVWSPQWLDLLKRVRIEPKRTYDASATPKVGDRRVARELKPLDLDDLQGQMAATIEKAKADDPRELRRQLSDRDRRIRELEARPEPQPTVEAVDVPVLTADEEDLLSVIRGQLTVVTGSTSELAERFAELEDSIRAHVAQPARPPASASVRPVAPVAPAPRPVSAAPRAMTNGHNGNGAVKGGAYRRMMIALAQRPGLRDGQLSLRAGMALSGTFDKYLGDQRAKGWVEGERRTGLRLTDAGLDALGVYDPLPSGRELLAHWLGELGGGKKRLMLEVLAAAYPGALTDHEVATGADMALSGTFDKYLGQLRTLELVTGPRGALLASEELFS